MERNPITFRFIIGIRFITIWVTGINQTVEGYSSAVGIAINQPMLIWISLCTAACKHYRRTRKGLLLFYCGITTVSFEFTVTHLYAMFPPLLDHMKSINEEELQYNYTCFPPLNEWKYLILTFNFKSSRLNTQLSLKTSSKRLGVKSKQYLHSFVSVKPIFLAIVFLEDHVQGTFAQ